MPKELVILDQVIKPGNTYQIKLDIARLHTRTKLEIPVIISRAKKDGPCILISAGIHGNEVNGVEIVRQLVAKNYHIPDKGTIICIPVINVFGFIIKSRTFPDGRDLNRVFPGTKNGSLASKFAYRFMNDIVVHADYCIDYHTGGDSRFNYSHIRIGNLDEEALELAKVFGTKFIKYSSYREKSYRESASEIGKKVLLFEGGKSMDLNREVTKSGLMGALKVMDYLGIKKYPENNEGFVEEAEQIIFEESKWIRANFSGMYRSLIKNGKKIKVGDVIGTVSDPYGYFERKIISNVAGYVICLNHAPIVTKGDAVAHIALIKKVV